MAWVEHKISETKEEVEIVGITLDVKVISTKKEPLVGAGVMLYSRIQNFMTDENGVVR